LNWVDGFAVRCNGLEKERICGSGFEKAKKAALNIYVVRGERENMYMNEPMLLTTVTAYVYN
jgi:hypothetical protein